MGVLKGDDTVASTLRQHRQVAGCGGAVVTCSGDVRSAGGDDRTRWSLRACFVGLGLRNRSSERITWVRRNCRLLRRIEDEFSSSQPSAGLVIGAGIHLEPKTVALLLTLRAGGAHVVATGNLNSTQAEAVRYLFDHGVEVVDRPTTAEAEHDGFLLEVLRAEPHLILDNGGDLFARYLQAPYTRLLGGTEETTSGRNRLSALRHRFDRPILVINDSPIKEFAENEHAVGLSAFEAFLRITNRSVIGRRVTVFGCGPCGRGVAATFRCAYAVVSVVEPDPVLRLKANLDGILVPPGGVAVSSADVILTVTGAASVVTEADLPLLRDGAVLANGGHSPRESPRTLAADPTVAACSRSREGVTTMQMQGGRQVHLLTEGHMVNVAGPRPMGNSIDSMDLGFAMQARCLEAVARGLVGRDDVVVALPRSIDEQVAQGYLDLEGSMT